ncbi:MAG: tetratricopeptide repeat protein [Kiritimatiellales bacterium]
MKFLKRLTEHECRLLVYFLLFAGIWLSFGRALWCDFVNYDDDLFVYANPLVIEGLTWHGVCEVLTRTDRIFYYPLTMLSFMLDSTLYGLNPFGFHLPNLLLHTVNAFLLFSVLHRMTGSIWRSALAVAVFALHPLRTESVVWITERKDVLSGFFFMLMLSAYCGYVRRPFSWARYLPVFLFYLAGLMSKPMLVTAPVVLFLLDSWPLRRFGKRGGRIFWEKVPLLCLSGFFCVITLRSDVLGSGPAIQPFPFGWRIGNALVSCAVYVGQMIFPFGLALHYPAEPMCIWQIVAALLFLIAGSLAALLLYRKKPYILTGWFWYLVMLAPVLGIVRTLGAARADRFTYLPQVGLCFLFAWGLADGCRSARRRMVFSALAVGVLVVLIVTSYRQTFFWQNSETLWRRAIACTGGTVVAHSNLGTELFMHGDTEEAILHFREAIKLGTVQPEIFNNLGRSLVEIGQIQDAVPLYMKALSVGPNRPEILKNLGDAFLLLGDPAGALSAYELAMKQAVLRCDDDLIKQIQQQIDQCRR